MKALAIDVDQSLLASWRSWFAPDRQPFPCGPADLEVLGGVGGTIDADDETDTFHMYSGQWVWLTQSEFEALSLATRRRLLRGRKALGRLRDLPTETDLLHDHAVDSRIVWWPSLIGVVGDQPIVRYIEDGVGPSSHDQVIGSTWDQAEKTVTRARELGGTFASSSGPNCFATVMAAAGVAGAEGTWMLQEPFEAWLSLAATLTRNRRHDDEPGTVLVWRDQTGLAAHAAVTIGGGFALCKPSQSWSSPRVVWSVGNTIAAGRYKGTSLSRHRLRFNR